MDLPKDRDLKSIHFPCFASNHGWSHFLKGASTTANRTSGYSHGHAYQDQQDLELLQNTQNDSNSYHRTHRAHLLLHRTEHPLILNTYFNNSNVFFKNTFLPKELATEQTINKCILVKYLKLQRVPSSNKKGKYHHIFPIIPATVPRHRQTSSCELNNLPFYQYFSIKITT